jgi:hypothetical protein
MASEIGLRQAYATIKNAYKAKQRNPVTTASDLRSLVPVVTGKTQYTFPIIVGDDANNYPEAILLNRADAFTATEIGIFIGAKSSTSDTQYDWYSYPNATIFTATGAATAFKTLFNNAFLNATINNVQYLQNYSISRLRRAPIVQQGLTYGYGFTTTGATNVTTTAIDSFDGQNDGFYPLVPTLQLSGTSKIDITLNLSGGLTAASSGSYVIGLMVRGFLSLGASNLNK